MGITLQTSSLLALTKVKGKITNTIWIEHWVSPSILFCCIHNFTTEQFYVLPHTKNEVSSLNHTYECKHGGFTRWPFLDLLSMTKKENLFIK